MKDDDEPLVWQPPIDADIWIRLAQIAIAFGVIALGIHFEVENPHLIGVWAFCAAYGFTLALNKVMTWRLSRQRRVERLIAMDRTTDQPKIARRP